MTINSHTKISTIIREKPAALEAIIGISPRFEKLRNPVLRKLVATRTSIPAASKIGHCEVSDFFNILRPLGFNIDDQARPGIVQNSEVPAFMLTLEKDQLSELDVRPVISVGKDPLSLIMQKLKAMKPGMVLKVINSFYPEPLIVLLGKQGFDSFSEIIEDDLVDTYFYKKAAFSNVAEQCQAGTKEEWEIILSKYKDKLQVTDVRGMPMPKPMLTILDALDNLKAETALFVYHERIPVFLIPELRERNFRFMIREVEDGGVHILIYGHDI